MQARIDRMDELGQMIIKTSAILGMSFSRRMLDTMLPKRITSETVNECMTKIGRELVFCCAYADNKHYVPKSNKPQKYDCKCVGSTQQINDCKMLVFKSSTLQETAYEMYTESLRRKIHIKAGRYLEAQAHRCPSCGGGDFIPDEAVTVSANAAQAANDQAMNMPPEDINTLDIVYKKRRSSSANSQSPIFKMRKQVMMAESSAAAQDTQEKAVTETGAVDVIEPIHNMSSDQFLTEKRKYTL